MSRMIILDANCYPSFACLIGMICFQYVNAKSICNLISWSFFSPKFVELFVVGLQYLTSFMVRWKICTICCFFWGSFLQRFLIRGSPFVVTAWSHAKKSKFDFSLTSSSSICMCDFIYCFCCEFLGELCGKMLDHIWLTSLKKRSSIFLNPNWAIFSLNYKWISIEGLETG